MATGQSPFNGGTAGLEHITGVTMRSGQAIRFREPGASVTHDSLYALGAQGQLVLPSDAVASVWRRKVSPVRTIGLISGLAVVALALSAAAFANGFNMFGNSYHASSP
jgi:hypothetical protein